MEVKPVKVLSDLEATRDVVVSGSLIITTTASFDTISVVTGAGGSYNVDYALHEVNNSVYQTNANIANAIAGFADQYNKNRYIFTGSLDASGSKEINLTTSIVSGSVNFASGNLFEIAIDFLLDTNGDGKYRNDLTSYQIFASGSDLFVSIDAPASPNSNFRLSVQNQSSLTPVSGSNGLLIIAGPQGPQGVAGAAGTNGANGKTYITVANNLSTKNTIDTVVSNFSLSPSQAPNSFYLDVTGFTENISYPMIVKLYDIAANTVIDSDFISTTNPYTIRLNGSIPNTSNKQYELRYYSSGSSNNYVYLQTAIIEII
jgi:hypothetical protein